MLSSFHRFRVFMWTGENDSNTIHVDAYFFFWKSRKKIPIFENIRIRVDRVSGSKSVVSPQLMVLNSGSRYMISRYSVEEHKDSCCVKFLNPTIIAERLLRQPCLEALGFWQWSPSVQWSINTVHWYSDLIISRHLWRDLVYGEMEQHLNRLILF